MRGYNLGPTRGAELEWPCELPSKDTSILLEALNPNQSLQPYLMNTTWWNSPQGNTPPLGVRGCFSRASMHISGRPPRAIKLTNRMASKMPKRRFPWCHRREQSPLPGLDMSSGESDGSSIISSLSRSYQETVPRPESQLRTSLSGATSKPYGTHIPRVAPLVPQGRIPTGWPPSKGAVWK